MPDRRDHTVLKRVATILGILVGGGTLLGIAVKAGAQGEKIVANEREVAALNARVDPVAQKVVALDASYGHIQTTLGEVKTDLRTMKGDVDSMKMKVDKLYDVLVPENGVQPARVRSGGRREAQ